YRERRLPEQRAELYMKATDTMLLPDYAPDTEVTDNLGRLVGGSWEVHRDLVQHLAFHMQQRGERQGREIAETDLRRLLTAEPAFVPLVNDFIALTRLRGTLLEERLGRYRFLHLAFQEFLAARYLATIKLSEGGIQTVAAFLEAGPLRESWWREVVLLVAGYFAVTSPQTAHTFLERLAGVDDAALARPSLPLETQVAAAELAALAWLEWPGQRESLRQKIGLRFAEIFEQITLKERIDICGRLARTVDPRPGVGTILHNGQKLPDIVWGGEVPAERYTIADAKSRYLGEKPRQVVIPQAYRLARYPVTYAQFQCFVDAPDFGEERWWAGMPAEVKDWDGTVYPLREMAEQAFPFDNHPRERVSWYQAMAFGRWMTARLHAGELPAGALTGDVGQYEITLPHEYEWEVAARWPNSDAADRLYPWGPEFDAAKANTDEGGIGQTTAVGIYLAGRNAALGLYDLSGNVWEWCRNKDDNPDDEAVDGSDAWRVLRGGSWLSSAGLARAASRAYDAPAPRSSG
ncbi:MAG: SUMF1/EgtB/PvdO family nonheme iron enzyme, partial [Pseudomonadales bacterium]|nr:SUMF1/EgtB/PvdO family nonheme iron enzyme [Pseudomonadales bacterium]